MRFERTTSRLITGCTTVKTNTVNNVKYGTVGPMRFERTTSRLSAGCTTSYATGPVGFTLHNLPWWHLIVLGWGLR